MASAAPEAAVNATSSASRKLVLLPAPTVGLVGRPAGSSVVNAIGPGIRFHGHDVVAADDRWPYGVAGIRGTRQRRGTGVRPTGHHPRARESAPGETLVGPANGVMLDASAEGWLHG
ncbi:MAG: hypothetical protein QOJ28_3690 [Mycobacterium sp.]|jgi:hypothetical protein|nr:hypothetical protein [Mycobacterium sp.]